jgi:hypothetical protein
MRALSSPDYLLILDQGLYLHPIDQALLLLTFASPETSYEHLADWPLGRRNTALIELHRLCFGSMLRGWTACSNCQEKLEFELDSRTLTKRAEDSEMSNGRPLVIGERAFRLPSSRDLAQASAETDPASAALRLVEGCQLHAEGKTPLTSDELEEIGERMEQADPMAEVSLMLQCPACERECSPSLNVVAFVWEEVSARARRLLYEVHALASTYGWTEREVLGLSDHRRAKYLEMVRA